MTSTFRSDFHFLVAILKLLIEAAALLSVPCLQGNRYELAANKLSYHCFFMIYTTFSLQQYDSIYCHFFTQTLDRTQNAASTLWVDIFIASTISTAIYVN